MSQTGSDFFANLPGFDFLKSLSSAQTTAIHPWLKPTLDPKELDQRIQELKTVLFWLEQNTKLKTVVSYADAEHGHSGTIYKASNFQYHGFKPGAKIIKWNQIT